MGWRLGPGPVFVYEWLTTSRRWQSYALRAGLIWLILVAMAMVHATLERTGPDRLVSIRDSAGFGRLLYESIAWIELTLILLAAPAATAGAVCLDKARGTLDHMLVTDLSNAEIVLGKLFVRLVPVLGLVAATLPVLYLASLLGGIDPTTLLGLTMVAAGSAVLGCSLAMALSVHGRKTHEVVMMAYLLIVVWIMAAPVLEMVHSVMRSPPPRAGTWSLGAVIDGWLNAANPYFLALAPSHQPPGFDGLSDLIFLAGSLGVSAVLVLLATARIRRVALKQAGRAESGGRRRWPRLLSRPWLPGPSMDRNPVAWREWHRSRPSLMMRIAWGLYAAMGLLWVVLAERAVAPAARGAPGFMTNEAITVATLNMIQVSIGLVLLSVGAATALAEERARGSLDVLLSTPMSTRSILAGKWWGAFRRAPGVAIWPALTTAFLAANGGYWAAHLLLIGLVLAFGAAITSLGLAIATWVKRPGRAVALGVSIPVVLAIGWPILVAVLFARRAETRALAQALITGDPPMSVMFATMAASGMDEGRIAPAVTRADLFAWTAIWIAIMGIAAAVLFSMAVGTFDACLGRTPDDGIRPPEPPGRRSSLSTDELLDLVPSSADEP